MWQGVNDVFVMVFDFICNCIVFGINLNTIITIQMNDNLISYIKCRT